MEALKTISTKQYIGTKEVFGTPMNRLAYNLYRGWKLPEDENGEDEGFLVEYVTGGKPNHPAHKGYISWSPTDIFIDAYKPTTGMDFGMAINAMKTGKKVTRKGWNGVNMFIALMDSLDLKPYNAMGQVMKVNMRTAKHIGFDTPLHSQAYFAMMNAQGNWQPGWLASQSDMLATDWAVDE